MSIYQNGNKIMGENILDLNSDKVKEIADAEISSLVPTIKKNMLICPADKSPKEFALENSTYAQVIEFVQWTGTPHADSVAQYVTYKFVRGTDANWGTLVAIIYEQSKRTIKYCYYNGYQTEGNRWGDWVTLIGTKVADVKPTTVTLDSSVISSGSITYCVINSICYVKCAMLVFSNTGNSQIASISELPVPNLGTIITPMLNDTTGNHVGMIFVDSGLGDCKLRVHVSMTGTPTWLNFSYPVAEQ